MPHWLQLAFVFLAGVVLGMFFFGGLALTVRRLVAGGGVMLMLCSFALRGSVLIAGFWLLAHNHAEYWVACLLGFTAARVVLSKSTPLKIWFARREDEHAPHH